MAAASYNTDLTDLVADSATAANWAALGGGASGLNVETDYFIEGTRCVSKNAWAGAVKGMIEDTTLNTLTAASGNAVYMWVTHHTPGSLATKASGGIQILLGSASSTYNAYNYAGSDTIDYGAPWICALVDPDEGTQASGTITTANITCYGALANLPVGGPTKGSPFGIDEIRYGRSVAINDGVGAAATFTALALQNDNINNRWGQFQRTPGSTTNFTMQCRIEFGDTTNTTACEFSDANKNITIQDLEHVNTGFIEFDVTQASTVTLTNINMTAANGANTRGNWVTTSSTSVDLTGCSFTDMGTFSFDSNTTVVSCTFRRTDQITSNAASFSLCTFDNNTATSALVVASLSEVQNSTFVSDGTGHAVNLGTISTNTSMTWNCDATGYAGTNGSTGNETILVNVNSGITLTINDEGTGLTYYNTGTGTVNVVSGAVTVKVTAQTGSGTKIENARVLLKKVIGGATVLSGLTDANGVIQDTAYTYTVDEDVVGWARKSSTAPYYKQGPISGTITSTGFNGTAILQADE